MTKIIGEKITNAENSIKDLIMMAGMGIPVHLSMFAPHYEILDLPLPNSVKNILNG